MDTDEEAPAAVQHVPQPADPLQAQTALERRQWREDMTAHTLAMIMVIGFFALAFTALLGYVDLSQPVIATFLGTVLGYAVGKLDPILVRYYRRSTFIREDQRREP